MSFNLYNSPSGYCRFFFGHSGRGLGGMKWYAHPSNLPHTLGPTMTSSSF